MDRVTAAVAEEAWTRALEAHREVVEAIVHMGTPIGRAAALTAESFVNGGQLIVCGNGGSAADAQHIAAEFVGRYLKERSPFPAIALNANSSAVTAIANDYGFDEVFARQVRAHGRSGDVLLAISTSGDSSNVLRAAEAAREAGMTVIGLTGRDGGTLSALCDVCLTVPVESTPRIQEAHILIAHVYCGLVEDALS